MCRFVLYAGAPIRIASLVTEPAHSIINQSMHAAEREDPLNGDGFGVAWYVPEVSPEPAVFRDVTPAWNNSNLFALSRVTRSATILAHVRAATPGLPVSILNCHPFVAGPHCFMHNGYLPAFARYKRALQNDLSDRAYDAIAGSTDSEHLFAMWRDRVGPGSSLTQMADALEATIRDAESLKVAAGVADPSTLNLVVSDGDQSVVCRYASPGGMANSLYVHEGRRYECRDGVCRMVDADADHAAIIVASERLSADPGWDEVPANHLVMIRRNQPVELRPIAG